MPDSFVPYTPNDWYWIVAGDETRIYSSSKLAMLPATDSAYVSWLTSGAIPTRIDSMDSLNGVLTAASVLPNILPQDLMAQFTADDATKIQAAIAGNVQFWLLWQSMTAQKDPMIVTNARFLAGWNGLITVLGADRMAAIAAALNVTIKQ